MKKIDIHLSTVDKGLQIAHEFLNKIVAPPAEELGLLLSDQVRIWRFKKEVKLLSSVKEYIGKHNIKTRYIPVKILLPLLEKASLEEDQRLCDMWKALLVNYIDSRTNFTSSIFPYLLDQLSSGEAKFIYHMASRTSDSRKDGSFISSIHVNSVLDKWKFSYTEISNLIRLGLIRELSPKIEISKLRLSTFGDVNESNIDYEESDQEVQITELGSEFIAACTLTHK